MQNPTHRWAFDEPRTALDSVGTANGMLSPSVSRLEGRSGGAVHLDGTDTSFVDFGTGVGQFGTTDFTVALWLRTSEATLQRFDLIGNRVASSHGNFFCLRMSGQAQPPGSVSAEVDQDTNGLNYIGFNSTKAGLNDGKWHHVAAVRQGASLKLYIDGALSGQGTASGIANIANGKPFKLGRSNSDPSQSRFTPIADYDDVRVYNLALTANEVSVLASTAASGSTFPVGNAPNALALAGANLWVSNGNDNSLMKLRASDGTVLGTYPVTGQSFPNALAYDGTNIWTANWGTNNVTKLRESDGVVLGTYPVGHRPAGMLFDGTNIWIVNGDDNSVAKLSPSNGAVLGTYPVGANPSALAFDGTCVWNTNRSDATVSKLQASNGALVGTYPVGNTPIGIAYDGANIWVANYGSGTVSKLRASDGMLMGTYMVGAQAIALVSDGANIWVANNGANNVMMLRPSDGTILGTYPVGAQPSAVMFDGANLWVANFSGNSLSRL